MSKSKFNSAHQVKNWGALDFEDIAKSFKVLQGANYQILKRRDAYIRAFLKDKFRSPNSQEKLNKYYQLNLGRIRDVESLLPKEHIIRLRKYRINLIKNYYYLSFPINFFFNRTRDINISLPFRSNFFVFTLWFLKQPRSKEWLEAPYGDYKIVKINKNGDWEEGNVIILPKVLANKKLKLDDFIYPAPYTNKYTLKMYKKVTVQKVEQYKQELKNFLAEKEGWVIEKLWGDIDWKEYVESGSIKHGFYSDGRVEELV